MTKKPPRSRSSERRVEEPYAIVVALDSLSGLQTARILHARGVRVIGVAQNRRHWACTTNVCEKIVTTPLDSYELISTLQTIGQELQQRAVLVPCSDISVSTISSFREHLESKFHVRLPEHRTLIALASKLGFVQFALTHNLPIPQSYVLANSRDALDAADRISYPCVIKPTERSSTWDAAVRTKAFKVSNRSEFIETYERTHEYTDTLIAQQWIEGTDGDLFSCNCYFDRSSSPLVTFIARKIRQWPPVVGISSLGQEVRNDTVLEMSLRLFRAAKYEGLGYVEIKRDSRDGNYYIIEANIGRPTGRSAIAEAGGVELLYTMYCDAIGKDLPDARQQRYTGVKWIYLRQDLRSAYHYWKRGELSFREWLSTLSGKKFFALLSWRDPIPFFADIWSAIRKGANRRLAPARAHASSEGSR